MRLTREEFSLNYTAYANFMCKKQTHTNQKETTLPKKKAKKQPNFMIMLVIAVMVVIVILVIPIVRQPRVNVTIGQDTIIDASAQTIYIPLISTLFPINTNQGTGVYTIELLTSSTTAYFINNVPIGQYTFVLSNNYKGIYETTIILERNSNTVDTFPLVATF